MVWRSVVCAACCAEWISRHSASTTPQSRTNSQRGIIEEAPATPESELVHYIPHHGVIRADKATTKLRIVYDASCKASKADCSLNECLYRGEVILADLGGLLLRFRVNKIAVVSDIEKAFLQVGLQLSERDVTRFLWVRDPHNGTGADNLIVYRFARVIFGIISSPYLLAATVKHHLQQSPSAVAKDILENIYVDNVLTGKVTVPDAAASITTRQRLCFPVHR